MKIELVVIVSLVPLMECVSRWNVFSTNTLLQWANKDSVHWSEKLGNNLNIGVSHTSCTAIHLSMVVRDAAHYPSAQKMNDIKRLHEKIVRLKNHGNFPNLDKWKLMYDVNMADELSSKGLEEMTEFGDRIGKSFKRFIYDIHNRTFVKIVSSSDHRAINSSNYFEQGLRNQQSKASDFEKSINDSTLEFTRNCYNHERQQQENGSEYLEQFHNFSKTPKYMNVIANLRRKLGMKIDLTDADVYLINEWCAYGAYISNDITWCQLLSDEDRDILEYGQDLLNFYKYSYGHHINSKMACPLVRDIFNTIDSAIDRERNYFRKAEDKRPRYVGAKFYFGGPDTLIPLMTALRMFKDTEPLLAANMDAMKDRKFRTSQISSFASSIAFIIYACDHSRRLALNEFNPGQQTFRIQAFASEKRVPVCSYFYHCSYSDVQEAFSDEIENCNITDVCGVKPAPMDTDTAGERASSPSMNVSFTYVSFFMLSLFLFLF